MSPYRLIAPLLWSSISVTCAIYGSSGSAAFILLFAVAQESLKPYALAFLDLFLYDACYVSIDL